MPYLIFGLIAVMAVAPVILGLIIVAIAPSRTEAVLSVLREGRSVDRAVRLVRYRGSSAPDSIRETAIAAIESGEESINQRTLLIADYAGPTERRHQFERELA